jgi:hypothetical protein
VPRQARGCTTERHGYRGMVSEARTKVAVGRRMTYLVTYWRYVMPTARKNDITRTDERASAERKWVSPENKQKYPKKIKPRLSSICRHSLLFRHTADAQGALEIELYGAGVGGRLLWAQK